MDEDDEFGDLYTDVLQPFSNSSTSALPPPPPPLLQLQPKRASPPPPPPSSSSIDLNPDDDDEILYGSSGRDDQTLVNSAPNSRPDGKLSVVVGGASDSRLGSSKGSEARGVSADFQSGEPDKDFDFDVDEGGNAGNVEDSGLVIPGLGVDMVEDSNGAAAAPAAVGGDGMGSSGRGVKEGDEEWEEEDSDSEDDLQIVLNDTGPMGMDRGMMGDGEEDDDGDALVIVADGDPNQGMEEADWGGGDEAAAGGGGEGEKKEGEAAGKGNAVVAGAKIGYHHPFHSQFKYVRPGAAPMPGAGPPGAPGQLRPPMNLVSMPGRGRGDWRPMGNRGGPPMQKGVPGYGGWGNNMGGRGFGGGLDFTLPSHKTIFDIDIDNFEEKPWKYPGVDITDFFNFGLNEESWKDYCRQLEQHRLETTMQSKIRVYESGRAEQEFDPDLPPELAAATGGHDVSADNSNVGKTDLSQSDLAKASARARPPIPTGRPIQVETGYSDRQPSIDTRPPRLRDSDAIIEIQLQGSLDDDSSSGNDALDGENPGGNNRDSRVPDDHEVTAPKAKEHFDDCSQAHPNMKGGRKPPYLDKDTNVDGPRASQSDTPSRYRPSSKGQAPIYPGGNLGTSHEERRKPRTNDRSPHLTSSRSADEESVESMGGDGRLSSQQLSSPINGRDVRESSVEDKNGVDGVGDSLPAEGSSGIAKDERGPNDIVKDRSTYHSKKKQRVERPSTDIPILEADARGEEDDSKAARSSDNSKARSSGSSKDYNQKWQDGVDDEVVQGGGRYPSTRSGSSIKRHPKDMDGRQETERSRALSKSREGSYTRRDVDPSIASHHLQSKGEGYDRRKDRDNLDGAWQPRREEDSSLHNRKTKPEEMKKRERVDEMGPSRHRKVRESERSEKDEHLISRKQLDNGNYRAHYDNKDGGGSKHRGREDNMKHKYEIPEDYHSKRRKDEEYTREEMLHGHRESSSSHRRRERDDQQRIPRDPMEDYHSSARHNKDEAWLARERSDRPREREELLYNRPKQSTHEELFPKRERDDGGRGSVRSGRGSDEKAWTGSARGKDEYFAKDSVRSSEQSKKRERVEDPRGGNQVNNKERRSSRHEKEKPSARTDRAADTPDNQRSSDKKHKEPTRKLKEPEGGDHGALGSSTRTREDKTSQANNSEVKDSSDRPNDSSQNRNSSKRAREDASSDAEQPDSKKGRSKLERWSSHKEKELNMNSSNKSASSAKLKTGDRNDNGAPSERVQPVEKQHSAVEDKDGGGGGGGGENAENKDGDKKQIDDRHLETVEKLKKRSERFKLPLPVEKDGSSSTTSTTAKKVETPEAMPPMLPPVSKSEPVADSEVKPERPARRRRWVGN